LLLYHLDEFFCYNYIVEEALRNLEKQYWAGDSSLLYALIRQYIRSGLTELGAFQRIFPSSFSIDDKLLEFLKSSGLTEIQAYQRIYFLHHGDLDNPMSAQLIYTGMPDYWGGDMNCNADFSCCAHVFYYPATTLKDIIDEAAEEAGRYCEGLPEGTTSIQVRVALLEMLTDVGRTLYLNGNIFEAAERSYSDYHAARDGIMEAFESVSSEVDESHPGYDDAENAYTSMKDYSCGNDEIQYIMEDAKAAYDASERWEEVWLAVASLDEAYSDEYSPVAIILLQATFEPEDTLTLK